MDYKISEEALKEVISAMGQLLNYNQGAQIIDHLRKNLHPVEVEENNESKPKK